jgi:Zn-dependent protease
VKLVGSLVLLMWTLAETWFRSHCPGLAPLTYLVLGAAGAMVFPLSVFFHELAYVTALASDGVRIRSVSLYWFGAEARAEAEPSQAPNAVANVLAGTLVTGAQAVCFAFLASRLTEGAAPAAVIAVFHFAALANVALLVFNSIPVPGLDGGRLLLIALVAGGRELHDVLTRPTMKIGLWAGNVLVVLAMLPLLRGLYFAALWTFLIGTTLYYLSGLSYVDALMRLYWSLHSVKAFMKTDVIKVPRVISVETLAAEYYARYRNRIFAVVDDEKLVGMLLQGSILRLDPEDWPGYTAGSIATPHTTENTVTPRSTALEAFNVMGRIGAPELLVVDDGRLAGSIRIVELTRILRAGKDYEDDED